VYGGDKQPPRSRRNVTAAQCVCRIQQGGCQKRLIEILIERAYRARKNFDIINAEFQYLLALNEVVFTGFSVDFYNKKADFVHKIRNYVFYSAIS